jgi:hypothetical protein
MRRDKNFHSIWKKGKIQQEELIVVNLYAPNFIKQRWLNLK